MLNVRYPGLAEQKIWSYMMPSLRSPWSKPQSMAREQRRWWRRHSPAGCSSLQAFCWRSQQECGHPPHLLLWVARHCRPRLRSLRTVQTFGLCFRVGDYDKRVISKTTLLTTPELFRGLIQAIWQKNYQIWLKKTPWTLQKTKSGYLGPPP